MAALRLIAMSLTSRIFRGSALNAADLILRMGVMFLMTPFLVSRLGMVGFGTWVLLTSAISFLDLLDGGITLSGTRFLARTLGQGDAAAYQATAGTLAWLYRRIGWLCLAGTVIFVASAGLFVKEEAVLWESREVLLFLGCSMALRFFLRIHLVVLKSHVRYDLIVASGLAKLLLQTALVVTMLLNGYGLLMLALAVLASDVLDQILIATFSRKTGGSKPIAKPDKVLLKEILSYSTAIFLNTLGQFLRTRLDAPVLSLTTGVASVPVYNTGMRLLTLFGDLMNAIIGGPLLSGFCQVEGSAGLDALREKFLQAMRFSVPLAALGSVGLFAYGPSFLLRWLGPEFADSGVILRLLVVPFALWLMQLPATSMLLALNQHKVVMKATLAAGVFNLIVSLALAWKIGFYGVVIASMIEMGIFYGILVPVLSAGALSLAVGKYYELAILRPLAAVGLPMVAYTFAVHDWVLPDYLRLALLGTGLTAVAGLTFWLLILTTRERGLLFRREVSAT